MTSVQPNVTETYETIEIVEQVVQKMICRQFETVETYEIIEIAKMSEAVGMYTLLSYS